MPRTEDSMQVDAAGVPARSDKRGAEESLQVQNPAEPGHTVKRTRGAPVPDFWLTPGRIPRFTRLDHMPPSANAINDTRHHDAMFEWRHDTTGVVGIDAAKLRYEELTCSLAGNRAAPPNDLSDLGLDSIEADANSLYVAAERIDNEHYNKVWGESRYGLQAVNREVEGWAMELDHNKGADADHARQKGLERMENIAVNRAHGQQNGLPTGVPFDVEPTVPRTDLERLNDLLIAPTSAFVRATGV